MYTGSTPVHMFIFYSTINTIHREKKNRKCDLELFRRYEFTLLLLYNNTDYKDNNNNKNKLG